MKLTNKAVDALMGREMVTARNLIAAALGCSESKIRNDLRANEDNNDLTKVGALKVIIEQTGLKQTEILTDK